MHPDLLAQLERRLPAAAVAHILASAIPALPYRLAPAAAGLPLTASRVGGIGYWPQHLPLPANAHGRPLALLAQINLDELPAGVAATIGLPESGLLAFYLDGYGDAFGMNDADLRDNRNYRCAYFADTTAPAHSRDAWRAQNPAAYRYDDDDSTTDTDNDADEDNWADNWQDDPQTCLDAWLQAVGLLVSALNDPALTAAWDAESTALYNNSSAWIAAHRQLTNRAALFAALRAACPETHARITALKDPRAAQWTDDALLADSDAAFAARWQHDPSAEITAWLARRDKLVACIDDAVLSRRWQQERAALRGFEGDCARRYYRRLRIDTPDDLTAALIADHFCNSEARIRELTAATTHNISRAAHWDGPDAMPTAWYPQHLAALNRTLGYIHNTAAARRPDAQNTWQQYWRHDPRAVLAEDWAMQDELIAHYHDPALSAIWREEWRTMQDNAAAIIAAAQEAQVYDAFELDAELEACIPRTLAAMRAHFQRADPATQTRLSTLEQTLLADRMERLAARFAALGFHADPDAPPAPDHAAIECFATAFGEQLSDDPAAQAAIRRYISGDESDPLQTALDLAQTLHDGESPEETAAERETTQQYRDLYIADNDRYVASLHDDEYSCLWAEDRAALLAADITNRAQLSLLLNFSLQQNSNAYHLAHYHAANPVLLAVMRALNDAPADAADRTWYFPVHGEYAMTFRPPAEHYLLDDSADFAAHYGMSRDDWAAAHNFDPDDDTLRAVIARAQNGNHLRGYPFFTQRDPRPDDPTLADSVLLFQLDSSEEGSCTNILWGDSGVGAFYIDRADLAARRFDKAWFYWDCY